LLTARLRGDLGAALAGRGRQAILDELRRIIFDGDVPSGGPVRPELPSRVAGSAEHSRLPRPAARLSRVAT